MPAKWTPKRIIVVLLKTTGWIVASIVSLLVVLAFVIQIPAVQNRIVQKAVSFLEDKIHTRVELERISLSFPKAIKLTGLYLEDQKQDTLLYAGSLSVDTDLMELLSNTIELNSVDLTNTTARIKRSAISQEFNFDYIIKAFASESTEPVDTTASPWTFNIGDISLNDMNVLYQDSVTAIYLKSLFKSLDVEVDELDLNHSSIAINSVAFEEAQIKMLQWNSPAVDQDKIAKPPSGDSSAFSVSVRSINLKTVAGDYRNIPSAQHARINLGEFETTIDDMDLDDQKIIIEEIVLKNTFASYFQDVNATAADAVPPDSVVTSEASKPWSVSLESITLDNNNIQYDDENSPRQSTGVDFKHIWLSHVALEGKDIAYENGAVKADLQKLMLSDQSGFSITNLKGKVAMTESTANISDFEYVTAGTTIRLDAAVKFQSLASLADTYPDALVDLRIKDSRLQIKDILYFVPDALKGVPVKLTPESQIALSASAKGKVKDLTIDDLSVGLLTETSLRASGRITGLPGIDPDINLTLSRFYTTRKEVHQIVADTLIPTGFNLPAWINVAAKMRGSLESPIVEATVKSDIGQIDLKGRLKQKPNVKPEYVADVFVNNLMVGRLIGQEETMGNITMKASVDGAGFSKDDLNARIELKVDSFDYQRYTYRDFNINGSMQRLFFSGKAWMTDKNLDFTLTGDLDYNQDIPEYAIKLDLKNADFRALNFSERPLKTRFTIDANLLTTDFTRLNGNVDIRNVAIFNANTLYRVDSLLFASIDQENESKISIRSDIVTGDFDGTINLTSIPTAIKRHFNDYFSLRDTTYNKAVPPQKFTFSLTLKSTELITELLVPDLEPFVPGTIEGEFDSEADILTLNMAIAKIKYGSVGLDSILLNVHSDKSSFDYSLSLRKILVDTLQIEALRISGKAANDSIRAGLTILDSMQREKYSFGGVFYSEENALRFRFLPGGVMMYYAPWIAPPDNYLRFTKDGILAHNFSITNINERISLVTSDEKDARTAVVFKDLNLQNITNMIEGTVLADGLMNGNFVISGKGAFRSALNIKKLKLLQQEWGNLQLTAEHVPTGEYVLNVGLDGDNVDLGVQGLYSSDSIKSNIDLTANIARINLKIIEPFTAGQLKNTSGIITGELKVKGEPTSPVIRGFMAFNKASLTPSFVNSKFTMKDERLLFTDEGIVLENFRIADESNNVATIKGLIKTKDYTTFDMNLGLNARNFRILNSTAEDSELFYGKVGVTTTAKITGTFTQPKIDMQINLDDDSDFTYIVPQSEKGVMEQEGIIYFVDKDAAKDPFVKQIDPRDTMKSSFTGMDLTANIELDDKETFSVVIDPVTGDKLTVKGNATLTLDIDPSGDMQLSGRYEITEGSYDFTFYKLVKRKFGIEKGSTITWAGDPLDATMDIKASHLVETSAAELMETGDGTQNTNYRARLPFLVYLNIQGNLLTPDISFELDMPKDKQNASPGLYARLKDINTRESDVNKQVFALLILRRFVSDNIFQSQGEDVSSSARRSVSKLLTEQLNRLSQNIKGFELSVDVKSYEDYSSGSAQGQTAVQLGVSKSLLDDRLVVKVTGNVDIEGNASDQNNFSDYIGDLALEYKLTTDGRFRITGFRKSNYDIISGELIETGAGLIYIKDYNTLRELFKANAK